MLDCAVSMVCWYAGSTESVAGVLFRKTPSSEILNSTLQQLRAWSLLLDSR